MDTNLLGNRLLVVDHEPDFLRLIKNAAKALGFEVAVTQNPSTIVTKTQFWRPTVLMIDLRTAGIDGIQLLRALAEERCTAHVILMSAVDDKVMESAMQVGREHGLTMSAALHKPVPLEVLRTLLSRFQPVQLSSLSADLAKAISTDQLFLEYQLKFDCRLRRMTGVEALVRWNHPTLGVLGPDQFIPLAEETDLIHRVTDWVVVTAAQQMAQWHMENPALEVAVNIAAKNVEDLGLPDRLEQHCRAAGVDCSSVTLELTETGAMREALQMMDVLTRLRLKGFKLSIDDFGTGFSSLAQLQKMPFSEVKIDRTFVTQMTANEGCKAIAEIVIDLARKLGLRSVAEGVEDEAALDTLMTLGCDMAQGYHLARPVAAERIPAFICDYQLTRAALKTPATAVASPFANSKAWRRRRIAARQAPALLARLAPLEVAL